MAVNAVPESAWRRRLFLGLAVLFALYLSYIAAGFLKEKPSVSRTPEPRDVAGLFKEMVESDVLTTDDPIYQQILKMRGEAIPGLKTVALDRNIKWHFAAYYMLGQIHDRSAIPFLIDGMNSSDEEIRRHAVWGLDCILRKGLYNQGGEEEERVIGRYRKWWEEHKGEFARN